MTTDRDLFEAQLGELARTPQEHALDVFALHLIPLWKLGFHVRITEDGTLEIDSSRRAASFGSSEEVLQFLRDPEGFWETEGVTDV